MSRCTVYTMSKECFNQIDLYINSFGVLLGPTFTDTYNNIMNLPNFKSGCFTHIQANAFAKYYHE